MKKLVLFLGLTVVITSLSQAQNQENKREFVMEEGDTSYTMKKYYFCMLMAGENRDQSKEEARAIQKAHMAHIKSMAESGKLKIAGPFDGPDVWRGIFIFDVDSKKEAEKMVKQDPAVIAGRLKYKILPWWTSKGAVLD